MQDAVSYGVIGTVIVAKSLLLLLCWSLRGASDSAAALAQDHRNDVVTNSVTIIVLALLGRYPSVWWLDPATAMVLGLLILVTWTMTGKGHVQQLSGRVATPDQVAMLTYLAMNHDKRVEYVDTVRAYYVGSKVQVECDIILPKTMPLAEVRNGPDTTRARYCCHGHRHPLRRLTPPGHRRIHDHGAAGAAGGAGARHR